MFKKLLVILALTVSAPSFAYSCDKQIEGISGLSERVKQEMVVQCEQAKLNETTIVTKTVDVEKVNQYAEVAKAVAQAIGVAAKELGVAVNEFIKTPAGIFTAAIIAWKFVGAILMNYVFFVAIAVVFSILATSVRRMVRLKEYEEVPTKVGKRRYPILYTWKELTDNQILIVLLSYLAQISAILVLGNVLL